MSQFVNVSIPVAGVFGLIVIALLYRWLQKQDAGTMGIKEIKGIIMAGDTFGPIVDNAAGISQMAGLGEKTRAVTSGAFEVIEKVRRQLKVPGVMEGTTQPDYAKKLIEEGEFGSKGSPAHAATVSGDTFDDPLKDTAGPSLHILVKLQNIMSITLLPLYVKYSLDLFQ